MPDKEKVSVSGSSSKSSLAIVIMAAGKGTRLKSKHPKVLHEAGGKSLLAHVIAAAQKVVPAKNIYVIIGHEAEQVRKALADAGVNFIVQAEQRGTGHAVMMARDAIAHYDQVIVLSGDAPRITARTIQKLFEFHAAKKAAMTILTSILPDPTGYGRIIRKSAKSPDVKAIAEHKAASGPQQKIREINSGFYSFSVKQLLKYINQLDTKNVHGEMYLTDLAKILTKAGGRVVAIEANDPYEALGGNTRAELADIDRRMRMAKCDELMASGVTIFYPETCVIDTDVQVGPDTVIEPFVQLLGSTSVGENCRVRSYSVIRNTAIGDEVSILPGCVMDDSQIHAKATVGPYSRLRPGSEIGEGARVGNFVETKKMRLGKGSKANHLTYLGDAEIGEGVNIGAGTITCNYDGVHKHQTIIEDGVFVGSDSTLVAPIKLGKGSYIAAASCITNEVPAESLALGRARQIVKEGWAKSKRVSHAESKK